MPVADKTIHTRHAEIRLSETSGRSLPIVMLHGSGSARQVFAKQLSGPLAEIHRMIAIDLPGHGESGDALDPSSAYTISGLAAAVGDVLDELGIGRAIVYGWSLGGHVAIELMGSHPAVAGLMLTGTPPVARGPLGSLRGFHTHWDLLLASKRNYSERDVERFAKLCFGDSGDPAFLDMIRRADGRVRTNVFRSMMLGAGADQKRAVENADVPVAMVNGADDPFVRLGYIAGLSYRTLWDGRCHIIAGAGHAPFSTAAEIFNPLLFRFVRHVMEREFENRRQERNAAGAA
ncbi:alpha/beta fold hydrolase [Allomesorhizobium camelthorni]|uniref:Alpha/beta hydrolase n=1 Tax=Allomesorhizobium camelthorni TaxID=475069 RepID=A0A6G4WM07_9HYPH|nr:alpha/beta hydrolase [Mesorhizobium camelthorni]NGO55852.1 alpha/beta hydrolase [Mesorhizobium camelthorni]